MTSLLLKYTMILLLFFIVMTLLFLNNKKIKISFLIIFFSFFLLILFGFNFNKKNTKGSGQENIFFLIDLSKSMNVKDIRKQKLGLETRLDKVKEIIYNELENDLKEGLYKSYSILGFAGNVYYFTPLTNNIDYIQKKIKEIDGKKMLMGGSNIIEGLKEVENNILRNKINNPKIKIYTDGTFENTNFPKFKNYIPVKAYGIGSNTGGYVMEWDSTDTLQKFVIYKNEKVFSRINNKNIELLNNFYKKKK